MLQRQAGLTSGSLILSSSVLPVLGSTTQLAAVCRQAGGWAGLGRSTLAQRRTPAPPRPPWNKAGQTVLDSTVQHSGAHHDDGRSDEGACGGSRCVAREADCVWPAGAVHSMQHTRAQHESSRGPASLTGAEVPLPHAVIYPQGGHPRVPARRAAQRRRGWRAQHERRCHWVRRWRGNRYLSPTHPNQRACLGAQCSLRCC